MGGSTSLARLPVGPGESILWTARPRPRTRLLRDLLPLGGLMLAAILFALVLVPAPWPLLPLAMATWVVVLLVPLGMRSWRLTRTTYALTERYLYTFGPSAPAPIRLTALPDLDVVDEDDGFGSIAFGIRDGVDTGLLARRLGRQGDVILFAVPEPYAVLRRIEAMRDAIGEGRAMAAGTAAIAAPRRRRWRDHLLLTLIGLFWAAIGGLMVVSAVSSGLAVAVPWLVVLPAAFGIAGVAVAAAPWVQARRTAGLDRSGQPGSAVVTSVHEQRSMEVKRMRYAVDYRYEVLGRPYEGRAAGLTFEDAHLAGVGDRILIRFDPAHPERSVWASS